MKYLGGVPWARMLTAWRYLPKSYEASRRLVWYQGCGSLHCSGFVLKKARVGAEGAQWACEYYKNFSAPDVG